MTLLSSRETGPIARFWLIGLLVLGLAACASEPPGLFRADGSAATLGPKAAVVVESRDVEVEDPYANQNHTGGAYTGAVFSAIVADAVSDDGAVVAVAALAGLGVGWMYGEFSELGQPTCPPQSTWHCAFLPPFSLRPGALNFGFCSYRVSDIAELGNLLLL